MKEFDLTTISQSEAEEIEGSELVVAAYDLICQPFGKIKNEKIQEIIKKLPPWIRSTYTVLALQSEVENGGFHQYFWNSTGVLAAETSDDLTYIGANDHASLLKQAMILEKQESAVMAPFKRANTLEAFSKSYENTKLELIDDDFYKLEKLDKIMALYIRRNLAEIQNYFSSRKTKENFLKKIFR